MRTGPVQTIDEAKKLASLMGGDLWDNAFIPYMQKIKETAVGNVLRVGQDAEISGYYKGIVSLSEDIIDLKIGIGKQLNNFEGDKNGD